MGREIRRVPLGWEHPKESKPDWRTGRMVEGYHPMFDQPFEEAMAEWLDELKKWLATEFQATLARHPDLEYDRTHPYRAFIQWHGSAPDPEYYRDAWPDGAVLGFAVYETVSEGTPVTPTFATREELVEHLVKHGTDWDHGEGWARKAAEGFVKAEWAPSLMVMNSPTESKVMTPRDPEMYRP